MKVACLANINNMMFILCRYLRDAGIDAHLITLSDEPTHFSPEADSYDNDYRNYYKALPLTKSTIYKKESVAMLQRELGDYDFFIGSDIAPALLSLIGRKLNVFIPHGSDIYALPFEKKRKKGTDKVWWQREKGTLSKLQKIGIENTETILFPDEYDIHFPFKDKLNTKAVYHNTSGPMVYIPQYKGIVNNPLAESLKHYSFFKKCRAENELIVFSHSRHNGFDLEADLAVHNKGNDVLIKGFSEFVKNNPSVKAKLIFFDYGMNVEASKTLIATEGIDSHVIWMNLMPRKEIMFGLNLADISCGQYVNSWLTCGVVNETLASEVPLLHYREDELYKKDYKDLYPVLNANSPEEISQHLENYHSNSGSYKEEAKKGADWLHRYTVENPLSIISKEMKLAKTHAFVDDGTAKRIKQILKKHLYLDKIYRAQGKIKSKMG